MEDNNVLVPGFDDDKDDSLKFNIQKIPNIAHGCLVVLSGFIDTYNSVFFQGQITKLVTANYYNLIIDCSNLTGIASTGFGVLTSLLKMVHVMGGEIVLSSLQPPIMETIELLGFSHFFKISSSLEEAVQHFGGEVPAGMHQNVFPKLLNCPSCNKSLRAQHPGRFRCINCKAIISISPSGEISAE